MSKWFAVIILVATLIFTQVAQKADVESAEEYYKQMVPEAVCFKNIDDKVAKALDEDGEVISYIGIDENMGYGGPVLVGTIISPDGYLDNVVVLQHKETPEYMQGIIDAGYFQQYENKSVIDPLELDQDIDRVSGATLSSRAIVQSVQSVALIVAEKELKMTATGTSASLKVGFPEIAIALLFVGALFLFFRRSLAKYRLLLLGLSAASMGFWLNRPLTIAHIAALFQGYFPDINTNLLWYIVVIGAVVPALLTGKNIYCTYVCPFCAVQEATHLISRKSLPIGDNMIVLRRLKDIILFLVLFLAFLLQNPSVPSFEPFGTAFGLSGSSIYWYLLAVVLLASFFFRRFWCVAFCPVGTFLDKTATVGRVIRRKIIPTLRHKHLTMPVSAIKCERKIQDSDKHCEIARVEPTNDDVLKTSGLNEQKKRWSDWLLVVFYIAILIGIMLVVFDKWWVMTP
ncbi:MAG: 4Fe-4S binding protein [Eubacteriales bacterium]